MDSPASNIAIIADQSVEYLRIGAAGATPQFVFLHEGLGSVAMWRDFPQRVVDACGGSALVYSRIGYGRSQPAVLPRRPDYMHDEALVVLPRILDHFGVRAPILVGHSDGASIALIYAGDAARKVAATIAIAPHVFVESLSIRGIEAARQAFATTDLRTRLARYHNDAEATFRGWNDIWLSPAFQGWNIESSVARIECPLLLIQGCDDEYGTFAQLDAIQRAVTGVVARVELNDCGHAPQRDQAQATIASIRDFVTLLADGD